MLRGDLGALISMCPLATWPWRPKIKFRSCQRMEWKRFFTAVHVYCPFDPLFSGAALPLVFGAFGSCPMRPDGQSPFPHKILKDAFKKRSVLKLIDYFFIFQLRSLYYASGDVESKVLNAFANYQKRHFRRAWRHRLIRWLTSVQVTSGWNKRRFSFGFSPFIYRISLSVSQDVPPKETQESFVESALAYRNLQPEKALEHFRNGQLLEIRNSRKVFWKNPRHFLLEILE